MKTKPIWALLFFVGVLFLIIGFAENQFTQFFRKAIMICLECIGIG